MHKMKLYALTPCTYARSQVICGTPMAPNSAGSTNRKKVQRELKESLFLVKVHTKSDA